MTHVPRRLARVLGAALVAAATIGLATLSANPAAAQDAKPSPDCHGLAFEDPKGDATDVDRFDITGGFFTNLDGVAYANLRVADYSDGNATGAVSAQWTVQWTTDDASYFVAAESSGGAPTFNTGTYDATTGYTTTGDTTGKTFPGADGIISIVIPAAAGGSDGAILKAPEAHTQSFLGAPPPLGFGLLSSIDDAPDSGSGTDYPVTACAAGDAVLNILSKTKTLKVKTVNKKKSASFKLEGKGTALTADFKKGKKSLGKRKVSNLDGKATVKVKLKKKIKKGNYTLVVSGKNGDGADATATYKVKAK